MRCLNVHLTSVLILTTSVILVLSPAALPSPGMDGDGVVSWGTRRSVLDGGNSTALILARERTHRKDPLDHLNYYTGGWNISNKHYIASVLYTGAPIFLIAGIWFIGFGLFLLFACMCFCCCHRRQYGYSRLAYAVSLTLLVLFTVAAIIGSGILYAGQEKFHDSTTSTLEFVLNQANSTAANLKNVSNFLAAAKDVSVGPFSLPTNVRNQIDQVNNVISSAANTLDSATKNNKDDIFQYLDAVRLILIIVAAVMLTLAFFGFLLSISGLQCIVYILVVVGWILIALTFILCGVFLVLHNMTGDTCVAMQDWVDNPAAQSALSDIIPCLDPNAAQQARSESKEVTYQTAQLVNGIISNLSNANPTPNLRPVYYNQSGPLVPLLCNPYNPDKTNRTCTPGEVDLTNATKVWKRYECRVSNNVCVTVGRLTPDMYSELSSAVDLSYGLYHYGPFLANLVDCTFLRDTFRVIHDDHCPDLQRYSQWVYIGLLITSAAVMLSLILWVVYARERRHRRYTKLTR